MNTVRISYTFYHNSERHETPNLVLIGDVITNHDVRSLVEPILEVSAHADYIDADGFEDWINQHINTLAGWVLGSSNLEVTLDGPTDESYDREPIYLFNLADDRAGGRNKGCNFPNGSKYDGVWFSIDSADDLVESLINDIKNSYADIESIIHAYATCLLESGKTKVPK